jgi:lipopolysaccharide export system permease protein
MHCLTRYVLFQLFGVFLLSLGGMTVFMLSVGVMRQAVTEGVGLWQILQLMPYLLPDALRLAVPATILFASCVVFGRLAAGNEIIAMKSLGISPWRILWPCYVGVILLSFGAVWLNDLAVSWGREGIKQIVMESIEEIAYRTLKTQRSYSSSQFSINVKDVQDRRLIEPTFTFQQKGDRPNIVVRAEWAELRANSDEDTLTITLHNSSGSGGDFQGEFPDTIERVLPLSGASKKDRSGGSPSEMAMSEIPQTTRDQIEKIDHREQQLATRAGFEMLTGAFAALAGPDWVERKKQLAGDRRTLFRLRTEPHRRWAAGFSCLCFVAVGAPLAIRRRHGEFWTTFFLCFLPILIVYYPMLMVAIDRAKTGAAPPYTVWLGNVVLLVWGAWLLRRVMRY